MAGYRENGQQLVHIDMPDFGLDVLQVGRPDGDLHGIARDF
jgi:hypothetical protein